MRTTDKNKDYVFQDENYWFSFLTKKELSDLNKRTTPSLVVHDNFVSCLFYRFKYLYNPLTKQEVKRWKKVVERVEKTIKNENKKS